MVALAAPAESRGETSVCLHRRDFPPSRALWRGCLSPSGFAPFPATREGRSTSAQQAQRAAEATSFLGPHLPRIYSLVHGVQGPLSCHHSSVLRGRLTTTPLCYFLPERGAASGIRGTSPLRTSRKTAPGTWFNTCGLRAPQNVGYLFFRSFWGSVEKAQFHDYIPN